jgi:hypothetical protein
MLLPLVLAPTRAAAADAAVPASTRAELSREFVDPLTTVPQLFLQDAYTPQSFGTAAQANRVIARIIVPRVPRFSLFPFPQLIRPSLSLVTVPTGRGRGTRTGLGDLQLFDLLVLPWPGRHTGLALGVGPTLTFPTATTRGAGARAWQAGPAFGAIYRGVPRLLLGVLVQNPIAFAYTSPHARPVSALLVQPIALAYLGRGFYVKSADSTWTHDWHAGGPTLLPLSAGVGWVLVRQHRPPLNFFVSGEWMAWRHDAPAAPQATVRFGMTVAFPDLSPW